MPTPIITDGSMDRLTEAPRVVLPAADLYAERAARFAQLAAGHPMGDYLRLMAQLSRAQAAAMPLRRAAALDDALLARSRDFGMPPLAAQTHARAAHWREDLAAIAAHVRTEAGAEVKAVLDRLVALDAAALEGLADRVLLGTADDADASCVPFVGAALQVYFTRAAASARSRGSSRRPMSRPSVPRARCVRSRAWCASAARATARAISPARCAEPSGISRASSAAPARRTKGVHYLALEAAAGAPPASGAVRAEACDECKPYLKIVFQDKDPNVDPAADDLATLGLDVLVDEAGLRALRTQSALPSRLGITAMNSLTLPGAGEASQDDAQQLARLPAVDRLLNASGAGRDACGARPAAAQARHPARARCRAHGDARGRGAAGGVRVACRLRARTRERLARLAHDAASTTSPER